jgi:ATP-dependent helicase IRC3
LAGRFADQSSAARGTQDAHTVSFIDNWKQVIAFADYEALPVGRADDGPTEYAKRPPIQLISIELVRRLARAMHGGVEGGSQAFITMLPVGWYAVEFPTATGVSEDDTGWTRQLVMVFESEKARYESFVGHLAGESLEAFTAAATSMNDCRGILVSWAAQFYPNAEDHPGSDLLHNLFVITRHMAQTPGQPAPFFAFAERSSHDLDAIAQSMIELDLGHRALDEALSVEFSRVDRFWRSLYSNYNLFYGQYQTVQRRILDARMHGIPSDKFAQPVVSTPESIIPDEPSQAVKDAVFRRDHRTCCCCGSSTKLQVDHIVARYLGGSHNMDQLQALCHECNSTKNISEMNFRTTAGLLSVAPTWVRLNLPVAADLAESDTWEHYVQRSINFFYRCAAVDTLQLSSVRADESVWHIQLRTGNPAAWFEPCVEEWREYINAERAEAGLSEVSAIRVFCVS